MIEDSVIQEVRAAREAFARKHGYNLRSMLADLRQQDERGDWPVARLAPRPVAPPIDLRSGPGSTNAPSSIPAIEDAVQSESGQVRGDADRPEPSPTSPLQHR